MIDVNTEEVENILENYTDEVEMVQERRLVAMLDKGNYKDFLKELRDQDLRHLTAITGTDVGGEFEIIYHISIDDGTLFNAKVMLDKKDGKLETVTDIFPGVILYERELMDMFGIVIENHPDPRRLFLADDWPEDKHPLREGMFNYLKISEKNISEIKDLARDEDLDYELLLEAEKKNKNRKSLKEWIKDRMKNSGEEE